MELYKGKNWDIIFGVWCQDHPGYCIIGNDKESLSELTSEAWEELGKLEKELERVCKKVFGATMFNFCCLMNNAYRDNTKPQVHYHFVPRYKDPLMLFNKKYVDRHFGYNFWKWNLSKFKCQKDPYTEQERKQIFEMMKNEFKVENVKLSEVFDMGLKQEDYIYYLHKTSTDDPAVIEDIFNNGLKSWYGYSMHSTLAPIDTETLQKVGLEQVIMNYLGDSEDYNSVIVVKMPKDYMTAIVHRDGKVNPPVPVWKTNDDGTTSFTSHLIQGIYCKRVNKSFSNPNFSPVYDPTGLKYSDEQINYMWSGQLENWVSFAKSRTNLDYQTLCKTDNQNQNWTRLIQHYSDKFGISPVVPTNYTMSESDVQLLNSVRHSGKKF